MKRQDSMGKIKFVALYVLWALMCMAWYKSILFRCLEGCTFRKSKLVLWGLLVVFLLVGMLMKRKNSFRVFLNLATAYGIYTVLAYFQFRKNLYIAVLIVLIGLSVANAVFVMGRKIGDRQRRRRILQRRLEKTVLATQTLFGLGFAMILYVSGINLFSGAALLKPSVQAVLPEKVSEQTIANNIDTILLLQEECWEELTVKERLNVLQTVANIEQRYLGIQNELNVGAANMDESTLGFYSDATHEIVLNMDSLQKDSPWVLLDTVCHEAYHSYQYRVMDAYLAAEEDFRALQYFRKAAKYAEELTDYIKAEEDVYAYYTQQCEADAREYGESAVEDYVSRINEYLESKDKEMPEGY